MSEQAITPNTCAGSAIPDYELFRSIGRGAYGEVWLARNLTGSWVALKVVHRSSFDHERPFEREFEGIKRFEPISRSDPSQVAILHVGLGDGFFYYVMELADDAATDGARHSLESGTEHSQSKIDHNHPTLAVAYQPKTLKRLINDRGALPAQECLDIALSLTRALAHLHRNGLVHRDVKPSNVILVNSQAKLADIGLVTSVDATRSFVGTEGYLPPEGAGTPQADLYSLGKLLYEMSTGCDRKEFPALPTDIATRLDRNTLSELNAIVVRACQLDPRERYASAAEMLSELELLQQGKSVKHKRARTQCLVLVKKLGLLAGLLTIIAVTTEQMFLRRGTKSPQGPPTNLSQNDEAVRWYTVARHQFDRTPGDVSQEAIQAVERAILLDPKFVQAYTLRFEMVVWTFSLPRHEMAVRTRAIADHLMAIDPSLGEAHAALGWSEFCQFNWEKAEKELQTCLRLSPNYGMGYCLYALILTTEGRGEEARPYYKRALQLDPISRMLVVVAGFPDFYSRCYTDAIAQFEKALKLESNSGFALGWIGLCYETSGDYPNAIKAFKKMAVLNGEDPGKAIARFNELNAAFSVNGEQGYWENRLHLLYTSDDTDPQDMALVAVHLERKQEALDWLEKAFDSLAYTASWLKTDPNWDPLRDEPRFKAMLRRARFTE